MNVTPSSPDRLGRNRDRVRDTAASFVLHPEEQRVELQHMAAAVAALGPVGRDEMLDGLQHARAGWAAEADSSQKSRALQRMDLDLERLQSLPGQSLTELSSALLTSNRQRQDRLSQFTRLGFGLAVAGSLGAMATGHWAGIAVFAAGVGTAATAALKRYQTPERDTLSRLATYGAIAQQRSAAEAEVRQLVSGLGARNTHGVLQTDQGVQVGGVLLKRRRS